MFISPFVAYLISNTVTDPTIPEWMFNPAAFKNAQLLLRNLTGGVEKVIKYYNAYCVGLTQSFDGTANAANFRWRFVISPQAIAVGGLFHDNNWPAPEPIVDWDWSEMDAACHPERAVSKEPGLFSDIAHGVLDVVGMIPVVGELADSANALFYLAGGNKTDAALSAAAMIPIAGWAATGAKVVRKGVKIAGKARELKQLKKVWKSGADLMEKGGAWAGKLQRGSTGFLGSPRLSRSQLQQFKQQAKKLGAELEVVKDKRLIKEMDDAGAQAGFKAAINKLFVRKGATYYETAHEMTHAKHCAELGKEAYGRLNKLNKEAHVYENLMKEAHKLTSAEIDHAVGYINKVRKDFGLNPLTR